MNKPYVAEEEPLEPRTSRKAMILGCLGLHDLLNRDTDDALRALGISRIGTRAVLEAELGVFREERKEDEGMRERTDGDPEIAFGLGVVHGLVIGIRAARYAIKGKDFVNDILARAQAGEFMRHEDLLECSKCGRKGTKPPDFDEKMAEARASVKTLLEECGIEFPPEWTEANLEPQALCSECATEMVKEKLRGSD